MFANTVAGLRSGISEGHVTHARDPDICNWAHDIAAQQGCNILRLATAREGTLSEGPRSCVLSHDAVDGWTVTRVRMPLREVLPLGLDYEATLAGLGRHTRRNLRNARKLATAEGMSFAFVEGASSLPSAELASLARRTDPAPIRARRIQQFETYATQTSQPFRSALRAADGALVSYCRGFIGQDTGYLVYQLNDRSYHRAGPSLMHRGFLMEELAQRGCRELIFVHGCSGVLRHSCIQMVTDQYWVMRRSPAARLSAALLARLQPDILLGKLARLALSVD